MDLGRVVSVNVGTPSRVDVPGGAVLTAIYKRAVTGRVLIRGNNLQGDRQADLTVHGGRDKALYGYAHEHYAFWKTQLPQQEMPYGVFGENLTTEGISEDRLFIGDHIQIGTAVLKVTQPRMPCYKLNLRFQRSDMVKRFWQSGLSGFYFSVVTEGELGAGDAIERISEGPGHVSVRDVVNLYQTKTPDMDLLKRALHSPLQGGWREQLQERWQEAN